MKPTSTSKWFATGFTSGGVDRVDREKHALFGASVIRVGEAHGHGLWIDEVFIQSVHNLMQAKPNGIKARLGHPTMCSSSMGTFIGRWKNPVLKTQKTQNETSVVSDRIVGLSADLFLSSAASEAPCGDLRAYIESMAEKEPDMCGASIVFTRDDDAEQEFIEQHGGCSAFSSPDARNVNNYPHARIAAIHAADIVDDPAATDGMFDQISHGDFAAALTEWLDLNPEAFNALVSDEVLTVLSDHGLDQVETFIQKYSAMKERRNLKLAQKTIGDDGEDESEGKEDDMAGVTENPKNPEEPKGYCPKCGADVIEAPINGQAKCINGHQFPESEMKHEKPELAETTVPEGTEPEQPSTTPGEKASSMGVAVHAADAAYEVLRNENETLKATNAELMKKLAATQTGSTPLSAAVVSKETEKKTGWAAIQRRA